MMYALMAICTAVFAVEIMKGAGFDTMSTGLAIRMGANFGPDTLTGQWWRLLTSMFLHFGVLHLLMNMWCLWALGSLAERLMGHAEFLVLYFGTGLAGSLLSLAVHPQLVSAGASGAVFGIAGGLITYLWLKKSPLDFARAKKQLSSLGLFVAYNFIYSLKPGVDMMAHLGGLASGLVIAAALPPFLESPNAQMVPKPTGEKSTVNKRIAAIAAACAIGVVLACVGIRRMDDDLVFMLHSLAQIDAGKSADVMPRLKTIVGKQPDSYLAHFALGAAELHTNQIADAVTDLERADSIQPGNDTAEQELGAGYLMQEKYDLAATKFQQVLGDEPDNAPARLGFAAALLGQHKDQDAATEARKAIAAMPKDSESHAVLGQAEIRLGTIDDGIHEMETAVQLDPDNADLRTRLLAAYMATGRSPHFADGKTQTGAQGEGGAKAPAAKNPNDH